MANMRVAQAQWNHAREHRFAASKAQDPRVAAAHVAAADALHAVGEATARGKPTAELAALADQLHIAAHAIV